MKSWSRLRAVLIAGALIATSFVVIAATRPAPAAAAATASCTTTSANVPLLPPGDPYLVAEIRQNIFQVTDNHGLWAGIRYNGFFGFQIITWKAGVIHVLDSFKVYGIGGDPSDVARVVGITKSGAVIVDGPSFSDPYDTTRRVGYSYQYGKRFTLAAKSDWVSWTPTSVSPSGHIAGTAHTRHGDFVVEWNGAFSVTTVAGGVIGKPLIDQYDDMIWYRSDETHGIFGEVYRTPSGRINTFSDTFGTALSGSGRWVWMNYDDNRTGRLLTEVYDMAGAAAGAPALVRTGLSGWAVTGAVSGNLITAAAGSYLGPYYFYDAYFDPHRIPATPRDNPSFAVASDGTVAYTGTDGNLRFLRCALSSVGHEPVGRIYAATATGSMVTITGGAYDPDRPDLAINVAIYDETRTKTYIGDLYSGDSSSAAAAVWYKLQQHSFAGSFPATAGVHKYCVYGLNIGFGTVNSQLGCVYVTVGS